MSTHASAFRPSFRFRNISPARTTALALALAGTLAATTLAGCGLGKPDASTSDIVSPSISGKRRILGMRMRRLGCMLLLLAASAACSTLTGCGWGWGPQHYNLTVTGSSGALTRSASARFTSQ